MYVEVLVRGKTSTTLIDPGNPQFHLEGRGGNTWSCGDQEILRDAKCCELCCQTYSRVVCNLTMGIGEWSAMIDFNVIDMNDYPLVLAKNSSGLFSHLVRTSINNCTYMLCAFIFTHIGLTFTSFYIMLSLSISYFFRHFNTILMRIYLLSHFRSQHT